MKIDHIKEASVTSNVPQGNVTAMSISVDGMEHIMTLLTNLYKDPELAVIREYYTNALDAHVAAGVTDKLVLVTLPSWDSPTYVVQDFGIGMSEEDIKNIYAQYGASTKRNTNDQVGAFGLGCKSALTIATQFTVVSVKDGWKTTALISKTESGVNTINIVNRIDTAEGNGTTVKIPVPDQYSFNNKAIKFFKFSAPGLVKINGKEPAHVLADKTKVEDPNDPARAVYIDAKSHGSSYIIMGNVGYILAEEEMESSLERIDRNGGIAFMRMPKYFPVPIGAVDLTPSREGLRFTDKTMDMVDECMTFVLDDLAKIAQEEIDLATNLTQFFKAQEKWKDLLAADKQFIWNGEKVPQWIEVKDGYRTIERNDYYGSVHSSHTQGSRFTLSKNIDLIIVQGYTAAQYKKINPYLTPYMKSQDTEDATFLITNDDEFFNNKWVKLQPRWTMVHGDVIIAKGKEQRKKDRAAAAKNPTGTKEKVKYPVAFLDDEEIRWVPADEIPAKSPYVMRTNLWGNSGLDTLIKDTYLYHSHSDWELSESRVKSLSSLTDSRSIIMLGGGRSEATLITRVPTTYNIHNDVKVKAVAAKDLITDDVLAHFSVSKSAWQSFLSRTGVVRILNDIKDAKVRSVIVPEPATKKAFEKATEMINTLTWANFKDVPVPSMSTDGRKDPTADLTKKYPLVDAISAWSMRDETRKHIVLYLNAVHEQTALPPAPSPAPTAVTV